MNARQPRTFDRTKHLQLLAIGKAELGWDDEFYRGLWLPQMGATPDEKRHYSAKTLSNVQLVKAVEEMKRLGFKVKAKKAGDPQGRGKSGNGSGTRAGSRKQADDAQSKKIRALWLELHVVGKVRDPSEAALAYWVAGQVKSSHGVEALQWLDNAQASRIIEQLKQWLARPVRGQGKAEA